MNIHDLNDMQRAVIMSPNFLSLSLNLPSTNGMPHAAGGHIPLHGDIPYSYIPLCGPAHNPHQYTDPGSGPSNLHDKMFDIRATQDYGLNAKPNFPTWGIESKTPDLTHPQLHSSQPSFIERREPLMKPIDNSLPMRGPSPSDSPGNYTQRIGPIVQRIDASHGDLHLNQSIHGLGPKQEKKLFGNDMGHYSDFHRRGL